MEFSSRCSAVKILVLGLAVALILAFTGRPLRAGEDFQEWLQEFKQAARKEGIASTTTRQLLDGVQPNQEIMEKFDKDKQAEFKVSFNEYRQWFINEKMLDRGLKKYRALQDTLARIHSRFKVPPRYLLAIWGVESRYGNHDHKYEILPALVTLAYAHPRSSSYFRKQLLSYLETHQTNENLPKNLRGSWAGAMGQPQFLPTTYREFAVDFTGDGWADIWHSEADILASIANYVSEHGWKEGLDWGRRLEPGEKLVPGYKLITTGDSEEIRFGVTDNFHAVFSYNHSNHYALTVCQLADTLRKRIKQKTEKTP